MLGLLIVANGEEVNCEARETTLGCGEITIKEMAFVQANNQNFKNTRRVA